MTSITRLAEIRAWAKIGRTDAMNFGVRIDPYGSRPLFGAAGRAYHNGYIKTLRKRTSTMTVQEIKRLEATQELLEAKRQIISSHRIDQQAIDLLDKAIVAA